MCLAGVRGREQERSVLELSAELCAAQHRKVPALSWAGRWRSRNEESGANGDTSNPPPCRPGQLAEEQCRLAAPAGASRKDLVVLFRTRVLQLFQVIGFWGFFLFVWFFLPGIYPKASPNSWRFPAHSRNQHRPAQQQRQCTDRARAPLPSIAHPMPRARGHGASPAQIRWTRGHHPHPWLSIQALFLHPTLHRCKNTWIRPLLQTPVQAEQGRKASLERFPQVTALSRCTSHAQAVTESISPRAI